MPILSCEMNGTTGNSTLLIYVDLRVLQNKFNVFYPTVLTSIHQRGFPNFIPNLLSQHPFPTTISDYQEFCYKQHNARVSSAPNHKHTNPPQHPKSALKHEDWS